MAYSYWREQARKVILAVLADNPGLEKQELRARINAAYPFEVRQYHPYRIWLDEVKVQLGEKAPKLRRVKEAPAKPLIETPLFDGSECNALNTYLPRQRGNMGAEALAKATEGVM